MNNLPIALIIAALSGLFLLSTSSVEGTESTPPMSYGDLNCDNHVDTGDALIALSSASFSSGASLQAELCQVQIEPGEPFLSADRNCDGELNVLDALALLRELAGVPVMVEDPGCPMAFDAIGAPTTSLTCEAQTAGVGEPVACRYDISNAGHEPTKQLTSTGVIQTIDQAMSESCTPIPVTCSYGASMTFTVTAAEPGFTDVSLTACDGPYCATRKLTLIVQ